METVEIEYLVKNSTSIWEINFESVISVTLRGGSQSSWENISSFSFNLAFGVIRFGYSTYLEYPRVNPNRLKTH